MTADEHIPPEQQPLTVDPHHIELIDYRPPATPRTRPAPPRPPQLRSYKQRAWFLFLATCVSVFIVGMTPGAGPDGFLALIESFLKGKPLPAALVALWVQNGLIYAGAVLAILGTHEMGHYLQAKRYHIPATPPFFLPFPISPFGTMGAVIIQEPGVADRKAMFDIGISGPLAGLVVALPITWYGLKNAAMGPLPAGFHGPVFGDPLVIQWIHAFLHGPKPEGFEIALNPLLFAGWVGILITALNLMPIGQLDGGHIAYALLGRRAHSIAMALILVAVVYMVYTANFSYVLLLMLALLVGPRHPPTADDSVPLGLFRHILGWLTLGFIFIGFTPRPMDFI